jgi:DUSAM domain-containing protein
MARRSVLPPQEEEVIDIMADIPDWHPIRVLAQRVLERGEPLELTDDVQESLRRSAREVAIPSEDAERALQNQPAATTLLEEMTRRIGEGSDRLRRARDRAHHLRDAGDLDGACKQMEEVLAVEVVPFYRELAEAELEDLIPLKQVAASGRVDPSVHYRSQLPVLLHRIQRGHALELNHDMRAFLRIAAASAAIGEAETEQALSSSEHAGALLGEIMKRFHEGKERIQSALLRMMDLRDAGDLEGARRQMRDVLAVEVVPNYRRMAEENLRGLDEPPPEW